MLICARRVPGFAFLLACSMPLAAAHQTGQMNMAAMDQGPSLGVGAAFGPDGRLWVATAREGHVRLRHSDDLGKHFSAAVEVNHTAEKIDAHGENHPGVLVAADKTIYVVWTHPLAQRWTSEVRFARSTDGGKSFFKPVTLSGNDPNGSRGFATLAVAGNDEPVVAWIDNGDVNASKVPGKPHEASLDYSWSNDDGTTFVASRRMPGRSCECCRIALVREPDGRVAALFRGVHGDNIRDHSFAVLGTDGKPDHPARVTFGGWQVAACPEQGPGLAIGSNGVMHGVWYEARNGPAIWYGQLDPGHPPRHKLRIGGPGASHADVAVHGNSVWIVWNQVDARGYRLMERTSHDDGITFSAPRVIAESTVAVYSPQLLLHDGRAYTAWNTVDGFRLIAVHGTAGKAR